jgi:hypothetical protein
LERLTVLIDSMNGDDDENVTTEQNVEMNKTNNQILNVDKDNNSTIKQTNPNTETNQ